MSTQPSKRVARVLSISGDGHRTAIAAHVLAALEERTGQPLHKLFHLIVGEGAGAVLAMLVTLRSPGTRGLPLDGLAAAIALLHLVGQAFGLRVPGSPEIATALAVLGGLLMLIASLRWRYAERLHDPYVHVRR